MLYVSVTVNTSYRMYRTGDLYVTFYFGYETKRILFQQTQGVYLVHFKYCITHN